MRNTNRPKDADLLGALPALRRAARNALRLAIETGTPCYVIRAGKIVNIAAKRPAAKRARPGAPHRAHNAGKPLVAARHAKGSRGKRSKRTARSGKATSGARA